ncbi:MAG: FecR domain-containing protein [Pseudomonadota bacterium]
MISGANKDMKLDALRREALGWVQHLTSGQVTRADADALKIWLQQSSDHEAAFAEASGLWKNIGPAGDNLRRRGQAPAELVSKPRMIDRRALFAGGLAVAGAAGVYAIVRPPFGLWPSWAEFTADYRTGTGEQRNLALDQVTIRLNTQTSLSVRPPVGQSDQIRLIAGEASFTTASNSARSLVVLAAEGRVIAQNARFDVRHTGTNDGSSICVTCLAGGVRVEQHGEIAILGPGQQLNYTNARFGSALVVDPATATAWQQGVLIFRFTPLAEVIDEINRYRPGRVILLNDALGRSPVSGRFRIDHMDEIFAQLGEAFGAKVRSLPGGIVLLS